jgi:deoxyribodipyrimidine photo-lyase
VATASRVIVWFRQVLRVSDHPALVAAIATGRPVLPLYILDDEAPGPWRFGGARRWWLHHSLDALDRSLRNRGSRLILRRGPSLDILRELVRTCGASTVFASRSYEPWARRLEDRVRAALSEDGVGFETSAGTLLFEPDAVATKSGGPFKVFTPFWRAIAQLAPRKPQVAPDKITPPRDWPQSDSLERWGLLPVAPDWARGLRETWVPGEEAAVARLEDFLNEGIVSYHQGRDRPGEDATSRLSPYLANGEISPSTCWHAVRAIGDCRGVETFLRQLAWREFSYHLLFHWPDLPVAPFHAKFAKFPWRTEPSKLSAWQKGRTGYPIVDAGMRQLWRTGWMHNRVRMIAASFLVKHLLVPWQEGEAWFWDTLVDADLANNAASWQWVAGSGADAAPYFRIFNPVKQGTTFDPAGTYVRRWVPELAGLDARFIHSPWLAPKPALDAAGIVLGKTYPLPVVDHATARNRALAAFASLKAAAE